METQKAENTLINSMQTLLENEDSKNTEGLSSSLVSSKSLKDLDGDRQIEYWKNRALKAIQTNKELSVKIEELQNDLTTFKRRADRYEKRAERFSRTLHQSFKTDTTSNKNGRVVINTKEYIEKIMEAFLCHDTIARADAPAFIVEKTFDEDESVDELTECSSESSYQSTNVVVKKRT
jgi:hypothetical protein